MSSKCTSIAVAAILVTAGGSAVATPVQWTVGAGGNDHWYELVSIKTTWDLARADALARTYQGLQGYLATAASADENLHISTVFGLGGTSSASGAWLGGSDAAVEGEWRWMDGPETGQLFWQGGNTGTAQGYANWGGGWPNSEDYLVMINDSWASSPNDPGANSSNPASSRFYYFVEYSAAPPVNVPTPGTLSLVTLALAATGLVCRRRLTTTGSP
jgi:hypothetical protein